MKMSLTLHSVDYSMNHILTGLQGLYRNYMEYSMSKILAESPLIGKWMCQKCYFSLWLPQVRTRGSQLISGTLTALKMILGASMSLMTIVESLDVILISKTLFFSVDPWAGLISSMARSQASWAGGMKAPEMCMSWEERWSTWALVRLKMEADLRCLVSQIRRSLHLAFLGRQLKHM